MAAMEAVGKRDIGEKSENVRFELRGGKKKLAPFPVAGGSVLFGGGVTRGGGAGDGVTRGATAAAAGGGTVTDGSELRQDRRVCSERGNRSGRR